MGNTTIIELNHDRINEIESDTTGFILQILEQLYSFRHTGEEIKGGRVIAGFHRSGKIYDKWTRFKRELEDKK